MSGDKINVHWVLQHAEDTPTVVQMTREMFLEEVAKNLLSARLTTYIPVDSHNVIRASTLAIMYPLINVKYMNAVTNLWSKLIDDPPPRTVIAEDAE